MSAAARCLCLVLFFQAATLLAAPVSADQFERLDINGQRYLRVRDWVRAGGLDMVWVQPGKSFKVSNGNLSVVLTDDSRLMQVSGIGVWLSNPVVVQGDKAFVAWLDLKTAILPVFNAPRHAAPVRVIALDPGHGGRDRGFYKGSRFEKNLTLLLAQELRSQLTRAGLQVVLTRTTDDYVELADRTALARAKKADLFVSLHFNSAGEDASPAAGVETYCLTPVGARSTNVQGNGGNTGPAPGNLCNDRSLVLAYLLQRNLVMNLKMDDRAVRRARFEVLREATMPAALIEGGFLSNPQEANRLADPAFRRKMAKAITDGILAYKRTVDPS